MKIDYLIQNGTVIDPKAGIHEKKDIYIKDFRIVDPQKEPVEVSPDRIIDATDTFVVPGLIDFHTHIFHTGSTICIHPDMMLPLGTTATVDAGSAGCANFDAFYQSVIAQSQIHIKSFLEVYSGGQLDPKLCEDFNPQLYNKEKIARLFEKYPDILLGLKIRFSKGVVPDESGLTYVEKAVDLAKELEDQFGRKVRLCVHTTNAPTPAGALAKVLREGDIFCHCFQGAGNTILTADGKIDEDILAARERGVIFDAANGKGNFGLKAAKAALQAGFLPDIISSDLTTDKFNMPPYDKNLLLVMAKYLALGMDLDAILKAVTTTPAKIMGMEKKIGTLAPGAYADIAILKLKDKSYIQKDFQEDTIQCSKIPVPQLVILKGEIQYCQPDFYL